MLSYSHWIFFKTQCSKSQLESQSSCNLLLIFPAKLFLLKILCTIAYKFCMECKFRMQVSQSSASHTFCAGKNFESFSCTYKSVILLKHQVQKTQLFTIMHNCEITSARRKLGHLTNTQTLFPIWSNCLPKNQLIILWHFLRCRSFFWNTQTFSSVLSFIQFWWKNHFLSKFSNFLCHFFDNFANKFQVVPCTSLCRSSAVNSIIFFSLFLSTLLEIDSFDKKILFLHTNPFHTCLRSFWTILDQFLTT